MMALDRSPESLSTHNEFEVIFGSIEEKLWWQIDLKIDQLRTNLSIQSAKKVSLCPTHLVYDPKLKIMRVSSRKTFWPQLMPNEQEMQPLEHPHGNSLIWPSDLIYDPNWP